MTVGVGAEAWALPIGVPPGVVAVALAAVVMRGGGTTIRVPPGVVASAWTASVNPIFDLAKLIFVEKFLVDLAIK